MSGDIVRRGDLVRRGDQVLRPDPDRVITRLFLPGQETSADGRSRADDVVHRILALTDAEVSATLETTVRDFSARHRDLRAVFARHFALIEHRLPSTGAPVSPQRRDLIGAYFTMEYAVEAAALFNPSLVAHPDQSDLADGDLRVVMSVRGVGEGHLSSVGFRTAVINGASFAITVDDAGRHLITGTTTPAPMSLATLREALREAPDGRADEGVEYVLRLLPPRFTVADLDAVVTEVRSERLTRGSADALVERIRWLASCHYELTFPSDSRISERVLFPHSPAESHGLEDARFTRLTEDDGSSCYYATYTAFDGVRIAPHLIRTVDFEVFRISRLAGPAARDKGMALFPRRVGGRYLGLSRWDRESLGVAASDDAEVWGTAVTVQVPGRPWELIQLGNCGSPLETPGGWLVLTHGVGPMRRYSIGAVLLDLDDPTQVLGALTEPLLVPAEAERDGYVPNVVYSCGALIHGPHLVLAYGCSDSAVRLAWVDLEQLLDLMRPTQV